MPRPLEKTERQAVERHRLTLSAERCVSVTFEDAYADWVTGPAQEWRNRCQQIMMSLQREEMLKHRWIESEKADGDVGKKIYAQWIHDHAASWRVWYQTHEEEILRAHSLL